MTNEVTTSVILTHVMVAQLSPLRPATPSLPSSPLVASPVQPPLFVPATPTSRKSSTHGGGVRISADGKPGTLHAFGSSVVDGVCTKLQVLRNGDFTDSPNIPIYVTLPLWVINRECQLVDPDYLFYWLRYLKKVNVDGVKINCWWGVVEARTPGEYDWSGYKQLFEMIHKLNMKLKVVMSFHKCGKLGDDIIIPLPSWVNKIGQENLDIFFTDRKNRPNYECLSWGVDKEPVLKSRTAVQVYYDYMRSFREEFDELFINGMISEVEIGLGPCGELRYPSYAPNRSWTYPGIGEFQCYDKYMMNSLRRAAKASGHASWGRPPANAGSYDSKPFDTGFFCDGGDYDSHYGRFFMNWYSQALVDHVDCILSVAKFAFEGTSLAVKIPGVHWWYNTASHAAELTAGFYNSSNRDGYTLITSILQKHGVGLNLSGVELRTPDQQVECPEALSNPECLVWQVLNNAFDIGIPVAAENALPCYKKEGYEKILQIAKQINHPKRRHLSAFTYVGLTPLLFEYENIQDFKKFVARMHGEASTDLQLWSRFR